MARVAIIGGTGLNRLKNLEIDHREVMHTPYGEPSGPLTFGRLAGNEVVFLPRHGSGHTIPPHQVNYRANIWALQHIGIENVIAVAAVGGIRNGLTPATLVLPDQIIDYTWGRDNTFFEGDREKGVTHIDFTYPYCTRLRELILRSAREAGIPLVETGTYGATQGPRLETRAEIDRMERDGCDVVGMTGMPEAALAREAELCYAAINVVANRAAGRGEGSGEIRLEEIEQHLERGMEKVRALLEVVIPALD